MLFCCIADKMISKKEDMIDFSIIEILDFVKLPYN
jgi:hypothetical protein